MCTAEMDSIALHDSVNEMQQTIEAALSRRGKWASWVVIEADVECQTIFVDAIVVDSDASEY